MVFEYTRAECLWTYLKVNQKKKSDGPQRVTKADIKWAKLVFSESPLLKDLACGVSKKNDGLK